MPPDSLVDNLPCPLFAFWGEDDEEIAFGGGAELFASALDSRRLSSTIVRQPDPYATTARCGHGITGQISSVSSGSLATEIKRS